MTSSDCFEYAKNPHVYQTFPNPKIPESTISNPKKSFDHPRHFKSGLPPPPPPQTQLFKSLERKVFVHVQWSFSELPFFCSITFEIFKRYGQRKTKSNPIKQNLYHSTWFANVLFHFSGAVHTARHPLHGYQPKMVFCSRRKYPICNCVHSYSISSC